MWKDIVDFPDLFEISNTGEIRNKVTNRILKQKQRKTGYMQVAVKVGGRKGKSICFKVHREVAKAFKANPNDLSDVNHIDGDKTNNHVSNLEWCTRADNIKHAWDTGLATASAATSLRKLTESEASNIRQRYVKGCRTFGARALAERYGVSHHTILDIVNRKTYVL